MRKTSWIAYGLLIPSTIFLTVFFLLPLMQIFAVAFVDEDSGAFTLKHFLTIYEDINFFDSLKNTLLLTLVVVPVQTALALSLALLLKKINAFKHMYLYLWAIPLGISDLAAGIIWLVAFTETGYINSLLYHVGILDEPKQLWLTYELPLTTFIAIVIAEIWRSTATVLLILLAGLDLIPDEFNEAGRVFGASAWKRLTIITIPLLKPSLQTALILRTILAFEVFAVAAALAGTEFPVLVGEAYAWYFSYRNLGAAAAYGLIILLFSVATTLIFLMTLRSRSEQALKG